VKHLLLLVEDDPTTRFSVRRFFERRDYAVAEAETVAAAEETFRQTRPDAAVVDYQLPDGDGIELIRRLREIDPSVPLVVLTGHGTIDLAVRAIKEGAEQLLTKPVELGTLQVVVERLLDNRRRRLVSQAGKDREARRAVAPFAGESPAIRDLAERARKVLVSSSPVLIQGETGTGKGVLAAWLHQYGPHAEGPFVDLNCAGLARDFLESELFGHERGAFTGAVAAKAGLLEVAHGGTLFLDEIGDLHPEVQPKLLKVLEEQRFRRLGEVRDRRVSVRLIAASHHDLARRVEEGAFRRDLYYRICALPLVVPPLRERGGDVVLLARTLLERIAADVGRPRLGLSAAAEEAILAHPWPGNVRELRNALERAALQAEGLILEPRDLFDAAPPPPEAGRRLTLAEAEARHIAAVLALESGSVPRAAAVLGLSRSALYEKLRKHRIAPRRR
jgi:DNA-binding NtrC family response regulator